MDPLSTGLLIVLMVAAFYLLIIRPNNRRKAEQAKLQDALKPGARVMLSSGIYATVVEVGERQAVVSVAPGVEVTVLKQAVLQAVTPGSQYAEDLPAGHEEIDSAVEHGSPDSDGEPFSTGEHSEDRPDRQASDRDTDNWGPEGGEKR